jgi:Na+/proline symporter
VAWLFGTLYLISPVLWMIPPMIFRELEGGNLAGLDNEGAFFLMCKRVLPTGMLGLMLGGMIFATASSVTTTLNMSAAVFTNDIVRKFKSTISDQNLMRTARISTVVLGVLTIGVALLVPRLGGIVEVVLSVGAITGAPLFAPPIWALFSNRQTSFSIITATLLGLVINCFFKFLSPPMLNYSLDRAAEMLVGVLVPLFILGIFELLLQPQTTKPTAPRQVEPSEVTSGTSQNKLALKVMGITLITTGFLIIGLGYFAASSQLIVIITGLIVITPGVLLIYKYKR